MEQRAFTKPVGDTVAKINDEVAVGEDLKFQEKWWNFERIVWTVFALILVLDLAGAFGRGALAKAERRTPDGTMDIRYERIERTGTPSIMNISFGPGAVRNGKIRLFVSESVVRELGAQRVIPSPETTTIGGGGLTYVFPFSTEPAMVEFALQPAGPGISDFTVNVPGSDPVKARIIVVP